MIRLLKQTIGSRLNAQDGEMGKVQDFYFEDENWTVRYLVANTGSWLSGKQVLISPFLVQSTDDLNRILHLKLTREQVAASPPVSSDQPVSRKLEAEYAQHYGWPMYWYGPSLWGPEPFPVFLGAMETTDMAKENRPSETDRTHLRSVLAIHGYHIKALDGEIGHVEDFLMDDENWTIRYVEIDTRNWWPGKKVLIPPNWIDRMQWETATVQVHLHRQLIQEAPEYLPGKPVSREYEAQLYNHYQKEAYWAQS